MKPDEALGDGRRLRILRSLSNEKEVGLEELATMPGLTKSTVHDHIGLLGPAGLVRVLLDHAAGTRSYTLRANVLPEALQTLDGHLGSDEQSADRAAEE